MTRLLRFNNKRYTGEGQAIRCPDQSYVSRQSVLELDVHLSFGLFTGKKKILGACERVES